ncbi:MAG: hypothetical protein APF84_19060 [Gracilibacter sp. BRH_c7a]|nr:MAG: hypothetical protein APF84_19060 [Gracilibacter sp. BRH_c7a]
MTVYHRIKNPVKLNRVIYLDFYKRRAKSRNLRHNYFRYSKYTHIINLYCHHKEVAEYKTIQAVEKCRQNIAAEVDFFFKDKLSLIKPLVKTLALKKYRHFDYEFFISDTELSELILSINNLVTERLEDRFGHIPENVSPAREYMLKDSFAIIDECLSGKRRNLLVAEGAGIVSEIALELAFGQIIRHKILNHLAEFSNLSSVLLSGFGFDSAKVYREHISDTERRLEGVLLALKLNIQNDLQSIAAKSFYSLHDIYVEERLNDKIESIKQKHCYDDQVLKNICAR